MFVNSSANFDLCLVTSCCRIYCAGVTCLVDPVPLCLYALCCFGVLLTLYLYASMLYVVLVWLADPVPLCPYALCCVCVTFDPVPLCPYMYVVLVWLADTVPLCPSALCCVCVTFDPVTLCPYSLCCVCVTFDPVPLYLYAVCCVGVTCWHCTSIPLCSMLCWCDLLTLYLYAPMLYVVLVWLADPVPLCPYALWCVGVNCWPCTPIPLCSMLCRHDLLTLYLYASMLYDVLVWLADHVPPCPYALYCVGVTCWPSTSMPPYSMLCWCDLLTLYVYAPILYVVLVWLADPMLYVVPQLNHRAAFRSTVVDWHLVITRFVRSVMTTLIMTRWSAPGTWWWPLWLQRGRSPWLITLLNIPEVLNQSLLAPQPTKANPTTNAEEARIAMPTKTKRIRRMRVRFFSKLHLTNKRGYNHTKMF